MMNAHCQHQCPAIHGTTSGLHSAPTFVPELKIPVASDRSFLGNHSATVLIDAGNAPASPIPSANRAMANPTAAPVRVTTAKPVLASRLTIGRAQPLKM